MSAASVETASPASQKAVPYDIRRIAVLGAGTMGSRIAAHIANAGFPVLLLDMVTDGSDRSSIARQGRDGLRKSSPSAYVNPSVVSLVEVGNFADDLFRLS